MSEIKFLSGRARSMKHDSERMLKCLHKESSQAKRKSLMRLLKEIRFGAISGNILAMAFNPTLVFRDQQQLKLSHHELPEGVKK